MLLRAAAIAVFASAAVAQTPAPAWENPVKALLREGKPVVGLTITVPSADIASQAATLGFDFLWIEMEHSPITLESARNMILATRSLRAMPFVRVPVNELWTAKRALDIGALGVIFPFTSTPELARQAVAACKYPPVGRRGYGPGLATSRWPAPEGYAEFADRNAAVIVIIEEARAIERIDEIAAVPGIDVLFIGVNDLAFSLGLRGDLNHPKLQAAVDRVLEAGRKNNVAVGRPASAQQIPGLLKQGFRFFQAASDLRMMADGAKPLLDSLGKQPMDTKAKPLY